MKIRLSILICALLPLMAQAAPPKPVAAPKPFVQTGNASWYGLEFKGHKTANGERYDPDTMTAAHRKLPFGTYVRVTNLRNNQSVILRINNRGPYIKGRIIDVSRVAARKLDMIRSGVTRVRIETIPKDQLAQEIRR